MCARTEIRPFKDYCYYYAFYADAKDFLNGNEGTPTSANACTNTAIQLSYAPYAQLSNADKNVRSTCYPYYSEYTSGAIPSVGSSYMLSLDASQLALRWNETVAADIVGQSWVYVGKEASDDRQRLGFVANGYYAALGVSNTNVTVSSDQNWQKTLVSETQWASYSVDVACWSKKCPSFVHFNPKNFTFWTNAEETNGFKVNGTYIYKIDLTTLATGQSTRSTLTLTMTLASTTKVGINITMPFDLWYQLNKATIPWYSPPTADSSTSSTASLVDALISSDSLENLIETYGEETKDELAAWTDEDFATAYAEARQRVSKPSVPITVAAKMDQFGLLTINFNNAVSFPSYLLKNALKKADAGYAGSQQRRLGGLFWQTDLFLKNTISGARMPDAGAQPDASNFGSTSGSSL